jgi:hypothetical protein
MLARMSLAIAGPLLFLAAAGAARAEGDCRETADLAIWTSPESPLAGEPLRILAVAESVRAGELFVTASGQTAALPTTRRGGPPFSFQAEVAAPSAGVHRIELRADRKVLGCRELKVAPRGKPRPARAPGSAVWENRRGWDRATESFYSAWIESLFDAPAEESFSHPSIAPVLRDPKRNIF